MALRQAEGSLRVLGLNRLFLPVALGAQQVEGFPVGFHLEQPSRGQSPSLLHHASKRQ